MKYKELKELDSGELLKKIDEIQLELMKLKAQTATGTNPKNTSQIRQLRKTIAKIKTTGKLKIPEVTNQKNE